MDLIQEFVDMIKHIDGYTAKKVEKGIVLIPPKSKYYLLPKITINDLIRFKNALDNYISVIQSSNLKSTKMDEKHDITYFLFCLIKNLSNYDYNNFEQFIERYTEFHEDNTFSEYDKKTKIGMLDEENSIMVKRTQEYYGFETPFIMKTFVNNKHLEYELPLIRYGIAGKPNNKTAYIYAVQRKKRYGDNQLKFTKEIDKKINQVNSGVKSMRNVTPSMVLVSTLFIGMLQNEGISNIIIPDLLPRRYIHFTNVSSEEHRDEIQNHATNKFLNIFLRLENQLDGFNITALPNDIDSSMHISVPVRLKSNNSFLNMIYSIGRQEKSNLMMHDEK